MSDNSGNKIAIVGGSYLKELPGLENIERRSLNTPFGPAVFYEGDFAGQKIVFVNRHADPQSGHGGHVFNPSQINYAALTFALKKLGVTMVVNLCAGGSFKSEIEPGHFGLPDQFLDMTKGIRQETLFNEGGFVVHISCDTPVCPEMAKIVSTVGHELLGDTFHDGGTAVVIEGPRFATRAESEARKKEGYSYSTMTPLPMAVLLREAEICQATVVVVTDFDAWKQEGKVSGTQVMKIIAENTTKVVEFVGRVISPLAERGERTCVCATALDGAIHTPSEYFGTTPHRLRPILARVLRLTAQEEKKAD